MYAEQLADTFIHIEDPDGAFWFTDSYLEEIPLQFLAMGHE
jgi:hypothetical protein